MCKARLWTPQDRCFVSEIKEALAVSHRGPSGMPKKAVYDAIGRTDGWYSRVLNQEEYDWVPDLVDLRKIANVTGNREPLRILVRWMGEALVEPQPQNAFQLLADTVQADDAFTTKLSKDLADGVLSPQEAQELLPEACTRLRQAQQAFDELKRFAGGK